MKNIWLLIVCFSMAHSGWSQEQTLFGKGASVGGFGGPIWEFGSVGEDFGVAMGGGGGVIIDGFFMGGFGMGGAYPRTVIDGVHRDVGYGYGGLWFGYVVPSDKVVHLYASLKVGWGGVSPSKNNNFEFDGSSDDFFALVPEAGIELNVFRWFRVAGTVGYRWFDGLEPLGSLQEKDFQKVVGGLVLRFGGFGHRKNSDN